jgi:hypothetical protein
VRKMACQPLFFGWHSPICQYWHFPVDVFYVLWFVMMITVTLSVVGYICARVAIKGFKMNLSVQLAIALCFGGCIMISFCGIAYFGHGELYSLPKWFAALLFTLPITIVQIVCFLIFLLV